MLNCDYEVRVKQKRETSGMSCGDRGPQRLKSGDGI
jgi:hypothetical protein